MRITQERSLGMYILLSIVTLGIYSIYFNYCLARDANIMCEGDGEVTQNYIIAFLLGIITLNIYRIYWYYKLGKRLHNNAPRFGYRMVESGSDMALFSTFPLFYYIAIFLLIKNENKMAGVYNNGMKK